MKSIDEVLKAMNCFTPEKLECKECPYAEYHVMKNGIGPSCLDMLLSNATYYLNEHKNILQKTRRERLIDSLREVRGEK